MLDILHTHPFFWPEVRRGAEREIHDLAAAQAAAGHRVRLVTSVPDGLVRRWQADGLRITGLRRPPAGRFGATPEAATVPGVAIATAGSRADIAHAWHHTDAWALLRNRRLRRRAPLVLKLTGTVRPERIDDVRFERRFFHEAIAGVDEVWVNSVFAREEMAAFGVAMHVVPAGVDLGRFSPGDRRADRPTVLCTAAPGEPRKRVGVLAAAWPAVVARVPDAELVLAGRCDAATERELRHAAGASASSIRFVGVLGDAGLVDAYRSAWVTVAPAVAEALGLATLESLACGTPVVGARSGATPELVGDTGALYEPDDAAECADAIVAAIDHEAEPDRCREAALPYGWDVVAPLVEARYRSLLGRG